MRQDEEDAETRAHHRGAGQRQETKWRAGDGHEHRGCRWSRCGSSSCMSRSRRATSSTPRDISWKCCCCCGGLWHMLRA
ncbi:hypothetical protein BCR43DRAFT_494905 [Syncephalastrum racemosum]|uniref:Uncharacterized protein n=1 Tax=Syncephalastrum racemosum TaxID=13706 RepID=A0A1X2H8U6_SYNRA|nr:hypothetical protein BCR43DRAFT_494905 [Syncephalastrum racemosum]